MDSHAEKQAFVDMYKHYYPKVKVWAAALGASCPRQAEDMAHDIFMKLWEKRSGIADIQAMDGYLFSMARNHLIDGHAKSAVRKKALALLQQGNGQSAAPTDARVLFNEALRTYHRTIALLPPRAKEAFELHSLGGLGTSEIAALMGISKSGAKQGLQLARKKIKASMKHHR